LAAHVGNAETLLYFIQRGGDINKVDTIGGNTPIHWASRMGKIANMRILLDKGARIDIRNDDDLLPLHWAVMNGRTDCVEVMILLNSTANFLSCYVNTEMMPKASTVLTEKAAVVSILQQVMDMELHWNSC
jgi:ankyrin repeat protein